MDESILMEKVLLDGDLSALTASERLRYYKIVCDSLGLNPETRPFDYIKLNGKLTLYAKKDATEQLRRVNGVSVTRLEKEWQPSMSLYVVTAYVVDKTGRTDAATGAVSFKGLSGESLANAVMKAETKAKRRATLSICGLGFMDESEISGVPGATTVVVTETGEIVEPPGESAAEPVGSASNMIDWFGKGQKPADGLIDAKTVASITERFVGANKPIKASAHLKNHLRAHFHVDSLKEMTWEKARALINHLKSEGDDPRWYQPDTPEPDIEPPPVVEQPIPTGALSKDDVAVAWKGVKYADLGDTDKKRLDGGYAVAIDQMTRNGKPLEIDLVVMLCEMEKA